MTARGRSVTRARVEERGVRTMSAGGARRHTPVDGPTRRGPRPRRPLRARGGGRARRAGARAARARPGRSGGIGSPVAAVRLHSPPSRPSPRSPPWPRSFPPSARARCPASWRPARRPHLPGGAVVMLAGAGSLDAPVLGAAILLSAASFVGPRRISGGPSRLIWAAVGVMAAAEAAAAADRHPGHRDRGVADRAGPARGRRPARGGGIGPVQRPAISRARRCSRQGPSACSPIATAPSSC